MKVCEIVKCVKKACEAHGTLVCMNSAESSAFGADDYVEFLKDKGIRQSMDSEARWRDSVSLCNVGLGLS
jgi:hypothetical protein